jgi:Ohr subfamily peroxiredoxin
VTQEKKILYTAKTKVNGGRAGVGRTEDGTFEVQLKPPIEFGGQGGGANPEQLFAIGFAACFESNLRVAARRAQVDPKGTSIDSRVHVIPRETEPGNTLAVEMDVSMPNLTDLAVGADLIRQAHQMCPYSHATRGNIDVTFTINGHPVELHA